MLIAGIGAGLLNGETVKVLGGTVSPERAGMAAGLASTTRFIGILIGVAELDAILSNVARSSFIASATAICLDESASEIAAKRVTSGDLAGMFRKACGRNSILSDLRALAPTQINPDSWNSATLFQPDDDRRLAGEQIGPRFARLRVLLAVLNFNPVPYARDGVDSCKSGHGQFG